MSTLQNRRFTLIKRPTVWLSALILSFRPWRQANQGLVRFFCAYSTFRRPRNALAG
jgi:hypothetical protein